MTKKRARWNENFAKLALRYAGGPDAEVVDAACGRGEFYEVFKSAKRLSLVGSNREELDLLVRRHPNAQPILAQPDQIPLEANSVDLAFCIRHLHDVADATERQRVLAELARVSRRFVAISVHDRATLSYLFKRIRSEEPPPCSVRLATIIKEAAAVDLRVVLKHPTLSLVDHQRSLLFEKTSASA